MEVIVIETPSLGDRSYIVHDGAVGLVVDPQRDIDRILEFADEAGIEITHVAETHVHNDYVSGGLTLARVTGATYLHAAAEPLRFDYHPVADGDIVEIGSMRVDVRHTPGHTPHHLSYVVHQDGTTPAAFTGGSMLYGTVGRTDLISPDTTDELAHAQYQSVHALADSLPDATLVYPTHGFGSFCASVASDMESDGTLGTERRANIALTAADEDEFVQQMVAGLDAFPKYYAQMGPLNTAGATAVDLSPPAEVVVYSAGRPWGMPITLLADTEDEISQAQRQLVRIGIDRPTGAAHGGIDRWTPDADRRSYDVMTFAGLRDVENPVVLDARRDSEFASGHLSGSTHIPLHELIDRFDEVPAGRVYVHCQTGYRGSIASSLLDRAGRDVVLIDDDFDNAADSELGVDT